MRGKAWRWMAAATATIAAMIFGGAATTSASSSLDAGVGNIPQGIQSDRTYAHSNSGISNVFATPQQVSCYRPEVSAAEFNNGPNDGYSGVTSCPAATTGESTGAAGPYATQSGSNPGYPASGPQLVKDHSESDIRVDPTNPNHLIGSSKWFVSAEGYNHLLGFYESFDGGATWPVQGHIPGYEGWTDNTDPIGAFDSFGNYYEFILAYQFYYNSDGSHNFGIGTPKEPNPAEPAEIVSVAVRPHSNLTCSSVCPSAQNWISTHNGSPDIVASYDSIGNEPDKQWMTIDTNATLPNGQPNPNFDNIYLMWVDFHFLVPQPFVSVAKALPNGSHTDWSKPVSLPLAPHTPQGATYLLPHVTPDGKVYTTITGFNPKKGFCCTGIFVDESSDGGQTWSVAGTAVASATPPPLMYANTTFRDGIENTFTAGNHVDDAQGHYPLYVAYEDYSAGVGNVLLTASYDGGATWSYPIQVNDNSSAVDEFQPNLTTAADGTISVAFYDRRLACPSGGSDAANAGIALDGAVQNADYTGPVPPYGATNYCINASIEFYTPALRPYGNNIRLTQNTWDPQLNSPHPGSPGDPLTFIGDYFGNTTVGTTDVTTFVSTYNVNGTNPHFRQQQVIALVAIP